MPVKKKEGRQSDKFCNSVLPKVRKNNRLEGRNFFDETCGVTENRLYLKMNFLSDAVENKTEGGSPQTFPSVGQQGGLLHIRI